MLLPRVPLRPPAPPADAVRIGLIDSGIVADHPQLQTLIVGERAFAGSDPVDRIGHGTLRALALLTPTDSNGDGFYPAILNARVTDDSGVPTVDAVLAAIDWVAAEGARTAMIDLAFLGEADEYTELCNAIARHSEVLFVSVAGNFGIDVTVYPGACQEENLITVSNLQANGTPSEASGYGDIAQITLDALPLVPRWQYHLDLGMQAALRQENLEARREFTMSMETQTSVDALFQLALLDVGDNDMASAATRLDRALQMEPELATLWTHLGAVRFLEGEFDDAEKLLRKAITLDSVDERAYFNLGQTLLNLDRPEEAGFVFEQLGKINPYYPSLHLAIAASERATRALRKMGVENEDARGIR